VATDPHTHSVRSQHHRVIAPVWPHLSCRIPTDWSFNHLNILASRAGGLMCKLTRCGETTSDSESASRSRLAAMRMPSERASGRREDTRILTCPVAWSAGAGTAVHHDEGTVHRCLFNDTRRVNPRGQVTAGNRREPRLDPAPRQLCHLGLAYAP
jgi:hypothetical protein